MKKYFSFLLCYAFFSSQLYAQHNLQHAEDSILKVISTVNNVSTICDGYLNIARLYIAQNPAKETEYINKTIFKIEQSRNRKLIATYYIKVADQWNSFFTPERQESALKTINRGLQIAKDAQLNKEIAILLVRKAISYRVTGKINEALKSNEESIGYASLSKSDSVIILCELSHGGSLIEKDENLAAFKKFMHALNLAEISKDEKFQTIIQKRIGDFYVKVGQTEKAKDYFIQGLNLSKKIKDSTVELTFYQSLITLYSAEKDFPSAREYLKIFRLRAKNNPQYKQTVILAESSIVAQEDINKLPEFMRQNKGFFLEYEKYGMFAELNRLKGIIYAVEKKNDSAFFYLSLAKKQLNPNSLNAVVSWNQAYAYYLEMNKKFGEAATYIEENVLLAKKMQSLSFEKECYEQLDSLYIKNGNKEKEVNNKLVLFSIKDSLNKQQKANDLLGIEIDIENKRNEREAQEKQVKLDRRNNLQYMGISGFIVLLFIALIAMGKFKVKPWLIRGLGFLSFILLFEFIILLIDHQIHSLTHGEPLPILLIKIVIIAFLLPFHHWLEHKVINYLIRNGELKTAELKKEYSLQ